MESKTPTGHLRTCATFDLGRHRLQAQWLHGRIDNRELDQRMAEIDEEERREGCCDRKGPA